MQEALGDTANRRKAKRIELNSLNEVLAANACFQDLSVENEWKLAFCERLVAKNHFFQRVGYEKSGPEVIFVYHAQAKTFISQNLRVPTVNILYSGVISGNNRFCAQVLGQSSVSVYDKDTKAEKIDPPIGNGIFYLAKVAIDGNPFPN